MENLNDLDLKILEAVSKKYTAIKAHIPVVKMHDREITGIGMFVNLEYPENAVDLPFINPSDTT